MLVRNVLAKKGNRVHTCTPDETLADVADALVDHNIGSLIVMENDAMIGIITERDILRACAGTKGPLEFLKVRERMTRLLVVASPEDAVADVMCTMTERRIRHVPVVAGGKLAGIISIGDTVKAQHDELCRENHYLKSYIQS
jgi:CBS domain-containing protein